MGQQTSAVNTYTHNVMHSGNVCRMFLCEWVRVRVVPHWRFDFWTTLNVSEFMWNVHLLRSLYDFHSSTNGTLMYFTTSSISISVHFSSVVDNTEVVFIFIEKLNLWNFIRFGHSTSNRTADFANWHGIAKIATNREKKRLSFRSCHATLKLEYTLVT